jgi:hypothetical protein
MSSSVQVMDVQPFEKPQFSVPTQYVVPIKHLFIRVLFYFYFCRAPSGGVLSSAFLRQRL